MQNKLQFRNLGKHCKSYIHYVRHVGNGDLNYALQILKVCKHCKSDINCLRHVGNDDLNYVCHS